MRPVFIFRMVGLTMIMLCLTLEIKAQDPTVVAPDTSAVDTTPVTTPVAVPAAAETKTKKEGFNSHTRFGIRGAGIISKQDYESGTPTEDPEAKFGADLAIMCSIPIGSGFFMFQPELHWMQKGYKIQDVTAGELTATLNYLELPLLIRINFGGSLKVFAFTGPSVGYLMSGTLEDDNGNEQDLKEVLDDVEYSGHFGIGAGIGTLEVDIRYIAGLNDISDSENLSDVKNSSYGVGLTLKF